jgi:hypothetical protein
VIKEFKILFDKAYALKVRDVSEVNDGGDGVFVETLFINDHPASCLIPDKLCCFTQKAKAVITPDFNTMASYTLLPLPILVTVSYTSTCGATGPNFQYQVV